MHADNWNWEADTAVQAAAMQQGLMAQMGRLGASHPHPLAGSGGSMSPALPSAATAARQQHQNQQDRQLQQQQQQQQALQSLSPARGAILAGMSPLPALSLQAPLSLAHMPSGPLFSAALAGLPEPDTMPGLPDLSCFLDPGHASLA